MKKKKCTCKNCECEKGEYYVEEMKMNAKQIKELIKRLENIDEHVHIQINKRKELIIYKQ